MPSVPLPFVVTLLLGIMLVRLLRRDPPWADRWLVAMVAAYTVQSVLLGLHWGYGMTSVQPFQAVMAAAIPPLSWLGFQGFATPARRSFAHLLAPLLVAASWVLAPMLIDPALEALCIGYGVALLRLARRGTDSLAHATFDGAIPVLRAMRATGGLLIASAALDMAISLALAEGHPQRAGLISGLGSLVALALLGAAAVVAGDSAPREASPVESAPAPVQPASASAPDPQDLEILERLDTIMAERKLHHDPNLTLDRLARRLGLPARAVSAAINRARGVNVSHYVNAHRVKDACALLTQTDAPITRILLDVGFQTKSNFNREFLRLTGVSPSAWRAGARPAPDGQGLDARRLSA